MKKLATMILFAAITLLTACGTASDESVTGIWQATLTPTAGGATNIVFTDTLTSVAMTSFGNIVGSDLTITTNNGCLTTSASQSGVFTVGTTTSTLSLLIQTGSTGTAGNALIMNGTLKDSVITGTWSLSGSSSSCNGSGDFTMTLIGGKLPVRRM